ncbi:MAG TPA: GGDEF domain-containing protein [Afifellaceae bacterium]|nr:GGDEF domain-containing protein [Afifellaceae bacterium]
MAIGGSLSPEMLLVLLLLVLLQLPRPRRLVHYATHDPLTGLANRVLFADRLGHALARSRRRGRPGALLLLDLDGFKRLNDTFGHAAGDRALVAVAARLRGCLRETDTVARLGGDEFAVVLDGLAAADDAHRAVARIRAALAAPLALDPAGAPLALSASIGLAFFRGHEPADGLLRRADDQLYAAKRRRRGGASRRPGRLAGAGAR